MGVTKNSDQWIVISGQWTYLGIIRSATSDDFPGTAFSTAVVSRS
jgi:hypothetical protein